MTKIKVYQQRGRNYAAIQPEHSRHWFAIPVVQARQALRNGVIDYGIARSIPVVAA